jgi:hypothetical protein
VAEGFGGYQDLKLADIPKPAVSDGRVLVRMTAAGVTPLGTELPTSVGKRESVMTAQIINLAEYRKVKEAEEVRKVVNDYFAAHSQMMAWWLSGAPAG